MIDLTELRFLAADRAEITGFTGTLADLDPGDRERLIDAMAIIVSENPEQFTRELRAFSAKRIESPFFNQPIDEFTFSDAASIFTEEFSKQAKDIVTLQASTIKTALFLAAIGFGIFAARKIK